MEQETDDGVTPVISACQSGNSQQLKELIDQGVSLSQLSFFYRTIVYVLSYQFIHIQCRFMYSSYILFGNMCHRLV